MMKNGIMSINKLLQIPTLLLMIGSISHSQIVDNIYPFPQQIENLDGFSLDGWYSSILNDDMGLDFDRSSLEVEYNLNRFTTRWDSIVNNSEIPAKSIVTRYDETGREVFKKIVLLDDRINSKTSTEVKRTKYLETDSSLIVKIYPQELKIYQNSNLVQKVTGDWDSKYFPTGKSSQMFKYEYSKLGKLVTVRAYNSSGQEKGRNHYEYDDGGNLITSNQNISRRKRQSFKYDEFGRISLIEDLYLDVDKPQSYSQIQYNMNNSIKTYQRWTPKTGQWLRCELLINMSPQGGHHDKAQTT